MGGRMRFQKKRASLADHVRTNVPNELGDVETQIRKIQNTLDHFKQACMDAAASTLGEA
jgi:hypothetical protein